MLWPVLTVDPQLLVQLTSNLDSDEDMKREQLGCRDSEFERLSFVPLIRSVHGPMDFASRLSCPFQAAFSLPGGKADFWASLF